MEKEFNLSEKIIEETKFEDETILEEGNILFVKDVKEFIKKLKEELCELCTNNKIIDKLAGKDLID